MADVARACDKKFHPHLNVLDALLQCILAPNFDRELKLHVFVCIGDIILSCRELCDRYIESFMQIFDYSFEGCIKLHTLSEIDKEYAE